MEQGVAIAAIGLAATSVGGIVWLAKYFAKQLSKDLQEHTKAAVNSTIASQEQTKASKEVLVFMKNLNGKLAKATIQTVQEQTVEHQTVKHQD
jgi:hypothetical protein